MLSCCKLSFLQPEFFFEHFCDMFPHLDGGGSDPRHELVFTVPHADEITGYKYVWMAGNGEIQVWLYPATAVGLDAQLLGQRGCSHACRPNDHLS